MTKINPLYLLSWILAPEEDFKPKKCKKKTKKNPKVKTGRGSTYCSVVRKMCLNFCVPAFQVKK